MQEKNTKDTERMQVQKKLEENLKIIRHRLGVGVSFDIGIREMTLAGREMAIVYCNGLADNGLLLHLLRELAALERSDLAPQPFKELFSHYLTYVQVETVKTIDEAVDLVLTGQFVFFIDGFNEVIVVDARKYPGRTPEEPDTEKVVRGSRDGFTENIVFNTALTRRRIRDERLRFERFQVGERSKTDVAIVYLQDVADPGLVSLIREKISEIKIDGLPMADKSIQEFLTGKTWNPFPMVRYTERPDVAAAHILEGHVLIYVDTSPSVMITPTTFFHHVQHAEEYRQTPVTGAFFRWVRFLAMLASIFLPPLWLLYHMEKALRPEFLQFIGAEKTGHIPIIVQFFLADLSVDVMRMAAVHTPSPLATAMGLIAAVLIGEIAIKVGLFSPETVLYIAIASIGLYATPSYELSLANRLVRLFLLLAVYFFKVPGLMAGTTLVLLLLICTRSLNTPYFWPFIPFNLRGMLNILFRMSVPSMQKRPSIVHPQDEIRTD